MTDSRFTPRGASRAAARDGQGAARALVVDLDAVATLAADASIAHRLRAARHLALARLGRSGFAPSGHWINWAPVGLALALVMVTTWSLLADNAQSLDADLLADALPFDAYLDADFQASIGSDGIGLMEN